MKLNFIDIWVKLYIPAYLIAIKDDLGLSLESPSFGLQTAAGKVNSSVLDGCFVMHIRRVSNWQFIAIAIPGDGFATRLRRRFAE